MIVVILIAASIIFLIHQFIWRRRNLPPGPTPLPLVGNMLSFIRHPPGYEPFIRWEKRFGPVFTIWMGNSPVVVISDIEVLKATFVRNGDAFNDKFILDEFNQRFRGGDYGLIDVNGDRWRDHRRFALHQLRDFGLGRDLMQFQVLLEAENVAKVFSSAGSTEVCVQSAFNLATGSIINQFLFGYRFSEGREAEFRELKETLDSFLKDMGEPLVIILLFHPFLGNIFSGFFKRMAVYREKLMGFYERQIQEHRKEIDFDQAENKDYVEAFLKEQNRRQAEGDFESFSIDQLKSMCFDLWTAGSDTTTNTMAFIVAYAINYPQQQKLLHEELDRVIGSDRQVTISDKNDLPFVTAFINESQRMANIVPINLVRVATREVDVDGRVVPAGVGILHQIASVLYNEKVFPDTQKFDPRRFLDQNGQLKKVEELIPFSIGKRQCLGEGLARMELFLFTANLFNRFEFLPGAKGAPSLEKDHNAIVRPRSYTCIIKKRISS